MNKKYISTLLGYIGVGFIAGAVSHGFFSGTRSIVMALLGMGLYTIHCVIDENKSGLNRWDILGKGLILSLAIGMISGGLQHFLDSPLRSMRIIPVGFIVSYLLFLIDDKAHQKKTKRFMGALTAFALGLLSLLILYGAYMIVPKNLFMSFDGHGHSHGGQQKSHTMGGKHNMNHAKHDCSQGDNNCMNMKNMGNDSHTTIDHTAHMHSVESEETFLIDMIPHHQEAINTSKIIVERSENSALKALAQAIIDAQTAEITLMQGRISDRYPNSTYTSQYKNMMPDLTRAQGAELDRLYIEGMIVHHEGAVQMAQDLLKLPHNVETKRLAEGIIATQTDEIKLLTYLLGGEHGSHTNINNMNMQHNH